MRKGRRERIEKGSREGIEKETKRQFEEKEPERDPPLLEFLDPTLRCSHRFFKSSVTSWSSSIKICFYKLIESIIKKMLWCETEYKKKCAIGETECIELKSLSKN